jgi:hypothetical protein
MRKHHDYMSESHPNAGYGTYAGHDVVANVMRSIFHYSVDHFESANIPGDYASPSHLAEALQTYRGFLSNEQKNLMKR